MAAGLLLLELELDGFRVTRHLDAALRRSDLAKGVIGKVDEQIVLGPLPLVELGAQ